MVGTIDLSEASYVEILQVTFDLELKIKYLRSEHNTCLTSGENKFLIVSLEIKLGEAKYALGLFENRY